MVPKRSRSSSSSGVSSGEVEVMAVIESSTEGAPEPQPSDEHPKIYLQANHGDAESSEEKKGELNVNDMNEIRIGSNYQANIPEDYARGEEFQGETLMWSAAGLTVPEEKLNEFLAQAVKFNSEEEALKVLVDHHHDTEAALSKMANATSKSDKWADTDIFLYERNFVSYGKDFQKLKNVFPSRSIASVVEFYYLNKKQLDLKNKRIKKLKMDETKKVRRSLGYCRRRAKKRQPGLINIASTSAGTRKPRSKQDPVTPPMSCANCDADCIELNASPMGNFCVVCFLHWGRTGDVRPTQDTGNGGSSRVSRSQLKELQKYQQSSSKAVEQPNQKSGLESSQESNQEGSSMVETLESFLREHLSTQAAPEGGNASPCMVISHYDQTFQQFTEMVDINMEFIAIRSVPDSYEMN